MKYLLFLTTLTVSPYLFSAGGDEQSPSPFMLCFDNPEGMIEYAQNCFKKGTDLSEEKQAHYLDGYAALTLAAAVDQFKTKSGKPDYELACCLLNTGDKKPETCIINYEQSKAAGLLLLDRSKDTGYIKAKRLSLILGTKNIVPNNHAKHYDFGQAINFSSNPAILVNNKHALSENDFFKIIDNVPQTDNPLAQLQQLALAFYVNEKFQSPETQAKKMALIASIADQKRSYHLANRIFNLD